MTRSLNLVRDSQFTFAGRARRAWRRAGMNGMPPPPTEAFGVTPPGLRIDCPRAVFFAGVTQTITLRGGRHYRIEALAQGRAIPAKQPGADDPCGLGLEVTPLIHGRSAPDASLRRVLQSADEPTMLGGYIELPKSADAIRLRVGIFGASGTAQFQLARVLRMLPPDACSHALALPPPPRACPAPRRVESVIICDGRAPMHGNDCADDRGAPALVDWLCLRLGAPQVQSIPPDALVTAPPYADALILQGDALPRALDSLETLLNWARRSLVIVSLSIFARLARGVTTLRRVEQEDDPIHARVVYSNFITRGFTLHDAFPYACTGRAPGWQVQRQYTLGRRFKEFCRAHAWTTVLDSVCDADATSHRPICLYRQTDGGGVVVLDLDPLDRAHPSAAGESKLAMHLLANVLGRDQYTAGQFTVPAASELIFRHELDELPVRFDGVRMDTNQLIRVGADAERPLIVVRSGLRGDDFEGIYGALYFFKRLMRAPPFDCPYRRDLLQQYRIAWRPLCSPCRWHWGFSAPASPPHDDLRDELAAERVAMLIDVTTVPDGRPRIAFAADDALRAALLSAAATPAFDGPDAELLVEPLLFTNDLHAQLAARGTTLLRIECPGSPGDFVANSIRRTGFVTRALDQLIAAQANSRVLTRIAPAVELEAWRAAVRVAR